MRINWLGFLIILIAGIILVHNLSAWKDVEFGDETTYLGSGLAFSIPFKGGAQWGPLYAAWYALWHLFVPNTLDLYYFNWGLLSILAGLVVFLFFRSQTLPFWASLWLAILFLYSAQNLPLNPKISIAPFCLIVGTLAAIYFNAQFWPKSFQFLLVSLIGLVCAYIRPEFYVSFLLGLVLSVFWIWKERMLMHKTFWGIIATFSVLVVLLHVLFENPLFSGDSSRSAVAFQQHFIVNYSAWQHQPEPTTIEAQLKLFHKVLGDDVNTFTDALVHQPSWAIKHVFTNLIHTLTANLHNVVDTFYHTLFRGWYSPWRIVLAGIFVILGLSLINYRNTWQNIRKSPFDLWGFIALIVLILPTLIATLLIYPRTHYLVFHLILILWLLTYLINALSFRKIALWPVNAPTIFLTSALVLFLGIKVWEYHQPKPTPSADNVRFITKITPKIRLRVLERDWYRVFLKESSDWIHVEEYTSNNFSNFVKEKDVNFILMTHDMQAYFEKDEGFQAFLKNHSAEGFAKLKTNSEGDYLLIKKTVL